MSKKTDQMTLNQLRDEAQEKHTEVPFKKKFLGGYNAKQVSEYIENLTENLQNAEESFNNRLDEYASMTIMLKQERDQYGEMFNSCKDSKVELEAQIDSLTKENQELKQEANIYQEKNHLYDEIAVQNLQLKSELNENRNYEQECENLKEQLDQVKLMVKDLSCELENYSKSELSEAEYENLLAEKEALKMQAEAAAGERNTLIAENERLKEQVETVARERNILLAEKEQLQEQYEASPERSGLRSENKVLKEQYEEIVREKSTLLAENSVLTEQNRRLSNDLREFNQKNEELMDITTKIKLNTQKIIAEFESRAYEYSQKRQRNIDKISESIKRTLDILKYEKEDVSLLIGRTFENTNRLDDEDHGDKEADYNKEDAVINEQEQKPEDEILNII
ncbi:hypothetical protein GH808_07890 [Acetobacterium fimetarium]|uniref:DivIVA domain-containing protein n=1 Tax=Acetobacterium fimetarium TaxID=52691 RepID=A0ABR6WUT9_9FIRM|nr:hypothetical protein [Acetobacterium fimetarium]MBC3804350.1 hypothetical protein [Acetobacterium fimetarium]